MYICVEMYEVCISLGTGNLLSWLSVKNKYYENVKIYT